MKTILALIFMGWIASMGLARAYSYQLDRLPLPLELQDTCMTGHGSCQDPEEVCIDHRCEAEQD